MSLVKDTNVPALLEQIISTAGPSQPVDSPLSTQSALHINSSESAQLWVSQLSATGAVQTAIELYKSLPHVIALEIDPYSKLSILETLYPKVSQCTTQLLGNQLNQDTAKAVSLGQALTHYIYQGYKALAYEFSQQTDNPKQAQEKLGRCLFRSCQLLAEIQFNSLSHYLARPSYFWRDLHTLHTAACDLNIENDDLSNAIGPRSSIHIIYVKLLLINCTRPNHFSNYELTFIFNELEFWSSLAELANGSSGGLFVIDKTSNLGPMYTSNTKASQKCLILDTFNLVKFLNSSLTERANHNVFSDRISRRVIKDLVRQWGEKILRRETHIKDKAKVSIACGITSTLCMLSKTDSFEGFLKRCGESSTA